MVDRELSALNHTALVGLHPLVHNIFWLVFTVCFHHVLDALDLTWPCPSEFDLAQTELLKFVRENLVCNKLMNLILDVWQLQDLGSE